MRRRLLCITTGFSRSGAPIALFGLLKILVNRNVYDIKLIAYEEGPLHKDYAGLVGEKNMELLDCLPCDDDFRARLQNNYDLVIMNTAVVFPFFFFFQNLQIPVYWWLHEAPDLIESSCPAFPNPHQLSPNFRLFVSSSGSRDMFYKHYRYEPSVIPVPIYKDVIDDQKLEFDIPKDKVIFFIPAAFTYIKGQDILLKVIGQLPEDFKNNSFFIFCGYSLEKQAEYKHIIEEMAKHLDNVIMMEELTHDEVFKLMEMSHCIVAPSRIDTIPMSIIEGMMLNKLVLVSDKAGVSAYITDCKNGFVFTNEEELLKRLLLIINDCNSLKQVSDNGHKVWTDIFSPEAVGKLCDEIGL